MRGTGPALPSAPSLTTKTGFSNLVLLVVERARFFVSAMFSFNRAEPAKMFLPDSHRWSRSMDLTPDYDLLAATYLGAQEAGPRLRDRAFTVATYRQNNPTPGKRNARRADLAAASAARRLNKALQKIDIRTRTEAIELGIALRFNGTTPGTSRNGDPMATAGAAPSAVGAEPSADMSPELGLGWHRSHLAQAHRLMDALETFELGFAELAQQQDVTKGGGPARHDALQMGLQGLLGLWKHYRPDPATQSQNERGFAALALDMFAGSPVGFERGKVIGAVVDNLPAAAAA